MAHILHLHDDVSPISVQSPVALLIIFLLVACATDAQLDDIRAAGGSKEGDTCRVSILHIACRQSIFFDSHYAREQL